MNYKKNILIVLILIIALSCNSNEDNQDNDTLAMVNIESTLIAKDNLFGSGEEGIVEQNLIISDLTTWNNLITQMNSVNNVTDNFTETEIDFSAYKIIAAFDQIRGSGGHSLELDIMSTSENIIVDVTTIAAGEIATSVITQPFIIVKIPNSNLPILFR